VTHYSKFDLGWVYGRKNGVDTIFIIPVNFLNRVDNPVYNVVKPYESRSPDQLNLSIGEKIEVDKPDSEFTWLLGRPINTDEPFRMFKPDNCNRNLNAPVGTKKTLRKSIMMQKDQSNFNNQLLMEQKDEKPISKTSLKGEAKYWKVVLEYEPEYSDEIVLNIGDIIEIISATDDATWYYGKKFGGKNENKVFCTDYCICQPSFDSNNQEKIKTFVDSNDKNDLSAGNGSKLVTSQKEEQTKLNATANFEEEEIYAPIMAEDDTENVNEFSHGIKNLLESLRESFSDDLKSLKKEIYSLKSSFDNIAKSQKKIENKVNSLEEEVNISVTDMKSKIDASIKGINKEIESEKKQLSSVKFQLEESEWVELKERAQKLKNTELVTLKKLNNLIVSQEAENQSFKEYIKNMSRKISSIDAKLERMQNNK
ncbi:MAG: hypothetical protein MHPSP_002794, partial [Paramarteilia canceri]